MLDFSGIQAATAKERTVADSVVVLLQQLSAALLDNPANQAEVTRIATEMNDRADALAAAVIANTPPAPPTP